jgi:protein-histidine N-methyltransferase
VLVKQSDLLILQPVSSRFVDLSGAAETYRSSEEDPPDSTDSELNISEDLKNAFKQSLMTYGVHLRFFSGSWDTFDLRESGGSYNLVLTSETIYRMESVPSLIAIMRGACNTESTTYVDDYLCLVAAKVLYFGVGGGVAEFVRCVRDQDGGGTVESVWERTSGVERRIMSVRWK